MLSSSLLFLLLFHCYRKVDRLFKGKNTNVIWNRSLKCTKICGKYYPYFTYNSHKYCLNHSSVQYTYNYGYIIEQTIVSDIEGIISLVDMINYGRIAVCLVIYLWRRRKNNRLATRMKRKRGHKRADLASFRASNK